MIEKDPRDNGGLMDHDEDPGPYSESSGKLLEGMMESDVI